MHNSKKPKISIVTVNYNKGVFLEETIKSVLDQSYGNLEYIIIDGNSTDNSVEIIEKYQDNLSYWISEEDSGMTEALIKGFQKATGEIYAWINSDDAYLPGILELVSQNYMKQKWDFLYGDMFLINEQGQKFNYIKSLPIHPKLYGHGANSIPQPSSFWSSNIYKKVGGIDKLFQIRMDADLFSRIFSYPNVKIIRLNIPLSKFRIHPGQSHSWGSKDRYKEEINIIKQRYKLSLVHKLMIKVKLYRVYLEIFRLINQN